jgi:hypothetical protein
MDMTHIYTDDEIEYLITCPKKITEPPKKGLVSLNGCLRKNMTLISVEEEHEFFVFIRINEDFSENFSVGLIYKSPFDGSEIQLFRCNGPHGPHEVFPHHQKPHIHIAKAEFLNQERKEPWNISLSNDYYSYEEAIVYFIKKCNIMNVDKYLPTQIQKELPFRNKEA